MNIIEKFLNRLCLDERIVDGSFCLENDLHMDVLQEYLEKLGATKEDSIGVRNRMLEGKYPERQAYNANGILVTFPTPEYKKRAIDRGTHFEKNPKAVAPNVSFDEKPAPAEEPVKPTEPQKPSPEEQRPAPVAAEVPAPPSEPEPPKPQPPITVTTPVLVLPPGEIKKREDAETAKAEEEYVEKILKN
jgi:hypothetical protein